VFFPRLTALYFLAYHCYFYYYPRGYFGLAAAASFLLLLHAMLYSITALEVPALSRYAHHFYFIFVPIHCHVASSSLYRVHMQLLAMTQLSTSVPRHFGSKVTVCQ
jgi:hypothetical protein